MIAPAAVVRELEAVLVLELLIPPGALVLVPLLPAQKVELTKHVHPTITDEPRTAGASAPHGPSPEPKRARSGGADAVATGTAASRGKRMTRALPASTLTGMASYAICRKWALATGAAGLVHNLFAWEGHAIAERLGLAAVAASPFMLARPPPTRFLGELERVQPVLCAALRNADPCTTVSLQHVDHWLWRLFLDDVGDLRETLGLPACPFLTAGGAVVDPLPAVVLAWA